MHCKLTTHSCQYDTEHLGYYENIVSRTLTTLQRQFTAYLGKINAKIMVVYEGAVNGNIYSAEH